MTLSAEDPVASVEQLALKLLSSRDHARLELGRKLAARGYAWELIDAALDRLNASGWLDEERMAERYCAERMERGFGPARIRGELREKGVADALIEQSLAALAGEWPECLARAHRRRFGDRPPVDRADFGKRARFLEQRGFTADSIRRFLRWDS